MLHTLHSLEDVRHQYQWFAQMRATEPVWLDETSGCWHVFGYEEVKTVLSDFVQFSSQRNQRMAFRRTLVGNSLIAMDPPRHRSYRNLVSPFFTPKALARLTSRITEIVQELLDQVRRHGTMDVIADLAYPLPTIVIAEMLGIPTTDRPLFRQWADALLARQLSDAELFDPQQSLTERFQQANRASEEMAAYFTRHLEERRRHPREDLMSALLAAEVEGERLSLPDIISFCTLLLIAGHVTTTNLIGNALLCFDAYPETLEQLRQRPDLLPGAIEEVLRYASPVWRMTRVTTSEVTVSGTRLPADAVVFAWIASANRDEAQFPAADRFEIERTPNRHVAFGHGIHFCLGAPLARLEASLALPLLLEHLPNLRRERAVALEPLESRVLFGVKALPMVFTPAGGSGFPQDPGEQVGKPQRGLGVVFR